MKKLFLAITFFVYFVNYSQTSKSISNSIPSDLTNEIPEIIAVDNELVVEESDLKEGLDLLSPSNSQENKTIKELSVPVFNLKDDPNIASLDAKWMDFVSFYEEIRLFIHVD